MTHYDYDDKISYVPFKDHIERAIERCLTLGVNKKIKKAPILPQKKSIFFKQPHIKRILDASMPSLRKLEYLKNSFHYGVTITDETGTIIYIDGHKNWLQEVEAYGFALGGCWDENFMGNNAIGTSIRIQNPIFFIGDDHIVELARKYACAGAPFYDTASGKVMGCVNISCRAKDFHISSMLAVMAMSDAIQHRLALTSQESSASHHISDNHLRNKPHNEFIQTSQKMRELFSKAQRAALFDSTKMILGETGVGKEVVARFIHNSSPRANKPFVAVNCGAIPRELVESELFGYDAGSFTGAKRDGKPGKFELANGGTIFLDEIGEMPYDIQSTLLRIIEDKQLTRIGASQPTPLDVQIVTSTNRDLKCMIKENTFREDLYYRLKVTQFYIPPLRERRDAIPNLAKYFLNKIGTKFAMPIKSFSDSAMNAMIEYDWPGNVRELEHVIEEAYIFSKENIIHTHDLNEDVVKFQNSSISRERERIIAEIERCNGNKSKVAKTLNISRVTLYRKMFKLGIPTKKEV